MEEAEAAKRLAALGWEIIPRCMSATKPGAPQKWGHSFDHLVREVEGWEAFQRGKKGATR